MKWSIPAWCFAAALLIFGPVSWRVLSWPGQQQQVIDPAMAMSGEELFKHEWLPNDPLCIGGDGLGPVFNAKSCIACHHQGGMGGAGGVEHNVTTFLLLAPDESRILNQGVLHAYATEQKFLETLRILDPTLPATSQPTAAEIEARRFGQGKDACVMPSSIQLSQRNTPSLFGLGLIDLIPEQAILANERKQRVRHSMASADSTTVAVGRVHRLGNGKIGRFGWKAQMATVAEFVEAACANELGLGNPTQAQPQSIAFNGYQPPGMDLTQEQCDQLTSFVSALPRPVEHPSTAATAGQALFSKVGCADCHTPSLGAVDGLYTDLLLHRMGDSLQGGNTSYGTRFQGSPGGSIASEPLSDEWRTPPLWGVADSAPYLHDGRAKTLEEAIRLHGGQGAASATQFEALGSRQQAQLVAFLQSLKAP